MLHKDYKIIIITFLLMGGILSYFLFEHISIHALGIFLFVILAFYFFESIFSVDFETEQYVFVAIISMSFLFFYYMQLYFMYVDKLLHLVGGIMLGSILYHYGGKTTLSRREKYMYAFFLSLIVILGYELYEFISDQLFHTHMQGFYIIVNNTLIVIIGKTIDTASDIILGLLGVIFYFFIKIR